MQCGQAPLADSSLGQSAPSQAQLSHPSDGSHPSHDVNQSGSRGSGLAAPAAQQLLGANLTSSSQQRSSGASVSQSMPGDARGSGDAATQPTPAADSGAAQVGQRRNEAGSGGGSSAGSRSQPDPRSTVAASGGTGRGCPPGMCHSDSLLSLQLTWSPVPAPSLQPLPTGQSFPTPQLAQRPPSQLSQVWSARHARFSSCTSPQPTGIRPRWLDWGHVVQPESGEIQRLALRPFAPCRCSRCHQHCR